MQSRLPECVYIRKNGKIQGEEIIRNYLKRNKLTIDNYQLRRLPKIFNCENDVIFYNKIALKEISIQDIEPYMETRPIREKIPKDEQVSVLEKNLRLAAAYTGKSKKRIMQEAAFEEVKRLAEEYKSRQKEVKSQIKENMIEV